MVNRKDIINQLSASREVQVLIIGGGVNGAGLFRELALQGVDVLLIDKSDFSSGASAASSRMIHGGLRYLENREVRLVKESLKERNLLLMNAPHYVKPLPTMIPIYHWFGGIINGIRKFFGLKATNAPRGAIIVKLGLLMYDIFTRKQRVMPKHRFTNKSTSLAERPLLDPNIVCTALFFDAWISYPERLGIELIKDALEELPHSLALNYFSIVKIENDAVLLNDERTGIKYIVKPKIVVNATGAWIDFTNRKIGLNTRFIYGTKGSHLMIDNPDLLRATNGQMVYYENAEGRICILFPLHGKVMVGSTDIKIDNPDEAVCTKEEVEYMLNCVNQVFPAIKIDAAQIVFTYSGVRPLPNNESNVRNAQISRDHDLKVIEPNADDSFPVLNLIGGKWTTFRAFAEQTSNKILSFLHQSRKVDTANLAIGGGKKFPKNDLEKQQWIKALHIATGLHVERIAVLLDRYGTIASDVANYLVQEVDSELMYTKCYTKREIEYLLKFEFVQHLDDLILRRTVLALSGEINRKSLEELADIFQTVFGLSEEDKINEINRTRSILGNKHHVII